MADPKFTDDERRLLGVAVKTLQRSIAVSASRSGIPLVQQAYAKQVEMLHVLAAKVGSLG